MEVSGSSPLGPTIHSSANAQSTPSVIGASAAQRSRLIEGRLPWGLFRATTITDYPHVGMTTKDTLTVDPTIESSVGQLVVKRNNDGEIILGILQRDGLREAYRSNGSWSFSWRQVACNALRRWSLAEIHEALGEKAARVLPGLLSLQPLIVKLPDFIVRAIELSAARDNTTIDDWLHRELMDFAGTVADHMERAVPGFRRAYLFPGRE